MPNFKFEQYPTHLPIGVRRGMKNNSLWHSLYLGKGSVPIYIYDFTNWQTGYIHKYDIYFVSDIILFNEN